MAESQFKPGTRVAINSRYGNTRKEAFVEKVYKSGNFTLKGQGNQQWRPHCGGRYASETGNNYPESCQVWDDALDARIAAENLRREIDDRAFELLSKIKELRPSWWDAELIGDVTKALEAYETRKASDK